MSPQFNDVKFAALIRVGYNSSLNDMEVKYLQDETQDYTPNSVNDLWKIFLDSEGVEPGNLNDRKFIYFGSLGFTANDLNAREIEYWQALPLPLL